MTRIEKIIVAVLVLLSLSSVGYIVSSWTSQGTPATAAPVVLLPPPRVAVDWKSTRWHMTREQVASISPHIAPTTALETKNNSNPYVGEALLKSRYVAQDIDYIAYYWFRDNKLVAVGLKPEDYSNWPRVNIGLEQTYGMPNEDKNTLGGVDLSSRCITKDRKWFSQRERNIITFTVMDCKDRNSFYSIRYAPMLATDKSGL